MKQSIILIEGEAELASFRGIPPDDGNFVRLNGKLYTVVKTLHVYSAACDEHTAMVWVEAFPSAWILDLQCVREAIAERCEGALYKAFIQGFIAGKNVDETQTPEQTDVTEAKAEYERLKAIEAAMQEWFAANQDQEASQSADTQRERDRLLRAAEKR